MRFETKREWIYEVGYKIKDYGYRVFVTDYDGFCFLHFTDGNRVGYLQLDLGGFSVITCTAPAFSVAKEVVDVTKEMCERALRMVCPGWYTGIAPRIRTFKELMGDYEGREGFYEI